MDWISLKLSQNILTVFNDFLPNSEQKDSGESFRQGASISIRVPHSSALLVKAFCARCLCTRNKGLQLGESVCFSIQVECFLRIVNSESSSTSCLGNFTLAWISLETLMLSFWKNMCICPDRWAKAGSTHGVDLWTAQWSNCSLLHFLVILQ